MNPESRPEEDGHIAALGELCDCNACLHSRDLTRARICATVVTAEEIARRRQARAAASGRVFATPTELEQLLQAAATGAIPLNTPLPEALAFIRQPGYGKPKHLGWVVAIGGLIFAVGCLAWLISL